MGNPLVLVLAMAGLLLTWALAAGALIGLGMAAKTLLAGRSSTDDAKPLQRQHACSKLLVDLVLLFWIGYAIAVGALQIWHMFWPVNGLMTLILLIGGLVSLATFGRAQSAHLLGSACKHPLASCAYVVLVSWAAMHALGVGDAHDSGLYHYPILQWLTSEAIVPGLGNLSVTFAHNSAHLLIAAALDQGFWSGRSEHVLNGLLVMIMALLTVRGMAKIAARERVDIGEHAASKPTAHGSDRWLHWYDALLIVPLVMVILSREITSPKTDAAPAFLVMLMVRELAVLFLQQQQQPQQCDQRWRFIVLAVLGATAVIVKLSTAPFVAAMFVAAALIWLRGGADATWKSRLQTALMCATIGIMLIGPWMARNVIMTGYPVFPARSFAFDVDWRVPPEPIEQFTSAINVQSKVALPNLTYRTLDKLRPVPGWLRFELAEDEPPGLVNWVPGWLVTMPAHSTAVCFVPLLLMLACGALVLMRRAALMPVPRALLFAAVPAAAALAFWFMTAPDPRYAIGLTWSLAGLCVAAALGSRVGFVGDAAGASVRVRRMALAAVLLPGVLAVIGWGVVEQIVRSDDEAGHPIIGVLLQGPGPDLGFHPRPRIETTMWHSQHGVAVRRPVSGTLIWDEPQPAIGWPDPPEDLAYREIGNLSAGFRVERVASE